MMGLDRIEHTRSIYTMWDFLGDVGGLFDMLRLLAEPLVKMFSVIFGSRLDRFLLAALFKKERRRNPNEDVLTHVKHRKPFKASLISCLNSKRDRNLYKTVEGKLHRELDIVSFLRLQMIDRLQMRLQFS